LAALSEAHACIKNKPRGLESLIITQHNAVDYHYVGGSRVLRLLQIREKVSSSRRVGSCSLRVPDWNGSESKAGGVGRGGSSMWSTRVLHVGASSLKTSHRVQGLFGGPCEWLDALPSRARINAARLLAALAGAVNTPARPPSPPSPTAGPASQIHRRGTDQRDKKNIRDLSLGADLTIVF